MKKLFIIGLLAIGFTSCKKEKQPEPQFNCSCVLINSDGTILDTDYFKVKSVGECLNSQYTSPNMGGTYATNICNVY
jgi:hypothetical protein